MPRRLGGAIPPFVANSFQCPGDYTASWRVTARVIARIFELPRDGIYGDHVARNLRAYRLPGDA
jgi:hypothetical protein